MRVQVIAPLVCLVLLAALPTAADAAPRYGLTPLGYGHPTAINDEGVVVGYFTPRSTGLDESWYWSSGRRHNFQPTGWETDPNDDYTNVQTRAMGVTDGGEIVGTVADDYLDGEGQFPAGYTQNIATGAGT